MSIIHVIGQVAWYAFLAVMSIGAVAEFREHNERMKHRPVNIGRRAASRAKYYRTNIATPRHIAKTTPAIVAKPRSRREPVAADPARADVISALRNLGWNASQANAAYAKSVGIGLDERLKSCLTVMASEPSLWSKS